jgi:predicted ArsR family transcriptional regulator
MAGTHPKDAAGLEAELAELTVLAEPVRRRLYLLVLQTGEVTRERAARALSIGRALAAFHLDRLVEEGLLEADYRRLTGRRGPGAGRPAKVYRRSPRDLEVTVPARRYELLARLLLRTARDDRSREQALKAAREHGKAVGARARQEAGRRAGRVAPPDLRAVLERQGFQPFADGDQIRLGNCPFDSLVRDHRDLVCGMNLELLRGMLAGLGSGGLRARLERTPGSCCVAFARRKSTSATL